MTRIAQTIAAALATTLAPMLIQYLSTRPISIKLSAQIDIGATPPENTKGEGFDIEAYRRSA